MAEAEQKKQAIPAPVLLAQEALRILAAEDGGLAEGLDKKLPAFAMQLSRAGEEVTLDLLLTRARAGELGKEAAPKSRQKTYAEIVVGFLVTERNDALHAARTGNVNALKRLIGKGADMDSALKMAVKNGHLDIVKYLVEECKADAGFWVFRDAVDNGHLDVVQYFAGRGTDIHHMGESALKLAAKNGYLDIVKYLVMQGADVHAGNEEALVNAARKGHLPVVKYLVEERGVDIHARWCLLRDAASYKHYNVVQYLTEHGADIADLLDTEQKALKDYLAARKVWQKVAHSDPPHELYKQDPAYFKSKAFEAVRHMLRQEECLSYQITPLSFHASSLFGTEDRVLQYLEKWGQAGKQPMHDIVYMIKFPEKQTSEMDLKAWGDAVLKCGPSMAKLVKFADRVPVPEKTDDDRTWSMVKTREKVAQFAYEKAAENPALAALCVEHAVDEEDFNKALKLSRNPPTVKNIPDITIDGAQFDVPGATFHRLAANDIRGLFLGEMTACCQSIGGAGEECAKHGFTSENSGFYVIENAKGRVVGQTWAWRGEKGELVFDSLETLGENVKDDQWQKLTRAFSKALANDSGNVTALHIGKGGKTPESLSSVFNDASRPAKPLAYSGYRDSKRQIVVWRAPSRA